MNVPQKDAHRSYQDTPFPDFRKHVGIWADLERLRPQGDCVLIRVIPEPEMHANLIWIPETLRGKSSNSPRVGEVIAIGLGDRSFYWLCQGCELTWSVTTQHAPKPCWVCASREHTLKAIHRHPMHVKPGDWVYYWRVFANQNIINDQVFQFVHEESQILGIIDKEGKNGNPQ